jgi:PAS domain S-box-containing protein
VIFVAASISAAVFIGLAAAVLPPLATAGLVLVGSLAAGLTMHVRRIKDRSPEPIADLRRELDQTRRGYRQLFAAVPCFICVLNRDHQVIEANSLYRTEFDVDDRLLCYEICKKRSKPCVNCLVDQTFANGEVHSGEETLVARDGRRVNVVVHTQPVYDDNNQITAVMEVFTDVTEVKRLQRQLALTGRAVAGMAHRVKNILMGLEGGIFIVNDGLEQDDRESIGQGWEMVERNVGLVTGIVKDLLYCSKDREPNFQPDVCPNEILAEVRDLFADRMAEEDIEILTEVEHPVHCGTFDRDGIHSLLCNLVANAIDACRFDPSVDKEGHTVVLRCKHNGEHATILEVEDDGAGIPEDLNNKVFQDFFSSKGTEGTGIGLLVVQKVAEEHGGRVTFESTPGKGTRFSVSIPSADLESSPTRADQSNLPA